MFLYCHRARMHTLAPTDLHVVLLTRFLTPTSLHPSIHPHPYLCPYLRARTHAASLHPTHITPIPHACNPIHPCMACSSYLTEPADAQAFATFAASFQLDQPDLHTKIEQVLRGILHAHTHTRTRTHLHTHTHTGTRAHGHAHTCLVFPIPSTCVAHAHHRKLSRVLFHCLTPHVPTSAGALSLSLLFACFSFARVFALFARNGRQSHRARVVDRIGAASSIGACVRHLGHRVFRIPVYVVLHGRGPMGS